MFEPSARPLPQPLPQGEGRSNAIFSPPLAGGVGGGGGASSPARATPVIPISGLVAALIGYAVFLFAPQVLNDGDTYSHIATGIWILDHGAVPRTDPFSYTFAGKPWVAHEWLSELLMGLAFRLGGWNAVLILFGAVFALTLALLARHLSRWLDPLPTILFLVAAAACVSPSLLARPHIFVLPIIEAWTAGLLIARDDGRVPWLSLPLMPLWANLHGSFILGPALAAPFALEAIFAAPKNRRRAAIQWGGFLAATIVLAMATPFGWRGLLFPFALMGMKTLGGIGEWRAPDFQTIQPIEVALMAALYVGFSRGVKVPVMRLLVVLGLLHLALQHTRHQMLAGLIGALVLAAPFGRALGTAATAAQFARARILPAGIAGLFVALTVARLAYPAGRVDGPTSPISALAHVPKSLADQPVLNQYDFGGYLIFRGVRPFIDARADMYGDAFMNQYADMTRPDPALLEGTLAAKDIQWTILAANSPAVAVLDGLSGWRRLYADEFAVVHVRNDAK